VEEPHAERARYQENVIVAVTSNGVWQNKVVQAGCPIHQSTVQHTPGGSSCSPSPSEKRQKPSQAANGHPASSRWRVHPSGQEYGLSTRHGVRLGAQMQQARRYRWHGEGAWWEEQAELWLGRQCARRQACVVRVRVL